MKTKALFWSGFCGCLLFTATTVIGSVLHPGYDSVSQFISELYASGAPYADALRFYGYLPSGVLFMVFAFLLHSVLPKSAGTTLGCLLFGFGYGFGTVICSIFNCDAGCNPEFVNPSLSQFIHNLMGMLTYLLVPIGIFGIGIGLGRQKNKPFLMHLSIAAAIVGFPFMLLLNVSLQSDYKGLVQQIGRAHV